RPSNDVAARSHPLFQKLAAQLVGLIELLPVRRRQQGEGDQVFVPAQKVAGSLQLENGAISQVLREITHQDFVLEKAPKLSLEFASQRTPRSHLVHERRIQVHVLRNRIFDHLIDPALILQKQTPMQIFSFLKG